MKRRMMRETRKEKGKIDAHLLVLTLILTVLGLIAVTDASVVQALNFFNDKFYFAKQQAMWAGVGLFALFAASALPYKIWGKLATPFFIVSILLLIVVLIPQVGSKLLGARRWIILGPISIQPAELIKLSLAMYLAKLAANNKRLLSFLIPIGLSAGLIMLQPDLGTTIVVVSLSFSMLFATGVNVLNFLGVGLVGIATSLILIITSPYRRERLLTFFTPSEDPLGSSYHIKQVLLALGSGGLFGVGLGQSRQKYLFLPEAASDSIFSVIAEEVGFIGASMLIILFLLFIFKGLKIAQKAPDTFAKFLALGIVSWIGIQAFLNISSMTVITPLTGIPLPFFSYGGSSLVMILGSVGILLNISRHS